MSNFNIFIHPLHLMAQTRATDDRLRLCVELSVVLLILLMITCAGISPPNSARAIIGGFSVVFGIVLFCFSVMWDTNTPLTLRWANSDWSSIKYVSLREVNIVLAIVCMFVSVSSTLNFIDNEPLPLAFGILSGVTMLVCTFFITLFGKDVFPVKVNDDVKYHPDNDDNTPFVS
jgi:hypothetical protein